MAIPTTIHQLWKTEDVPSRYTALRESWRTRNPAWTIRLWTDRDLDALVESRYPELLELYRGYEASICRADLGRYLVLENFGGVYADLDCECLKPLDALLADQELVIGVEPDEHRHDAVVARSGLTRLLCPTFIASDAAHPFWRLVREHAAAADPKGTVLDLTGPFLLTRAYDEYPDKARITVPPSPVLYPFTKAQCWEDSVYDLAVWERDSRQAFAAHYWAGGWFRLPTPLDGLPTGLSARLSAPGRQTATYPAEAGATSISCLTAVQGWSPDLVLAIESYLCQTHPNRELVIVSPDPSLAQRLTDYPRNDIRLVTLTGGSPSLAALREIGAQAAHGALLCRWDAGELQDPRRLEIQLRVLSRAEAHAGLLARRLVWRPSTRQMAITADAPDPGSLLCQKALWPREEADPTATVQPLLDGARVTTIDLPRLSLRVAREPDAEAFEAIWPAASARFEAERCEAVAEELAKRLPMGLVRRQIADAAPRRRQPSPPGEILILTPVKNGRRHLPRYFELISRLDSGGAPLSVAFMEGDSRDGSFEALEAARPSLEHRFARVETERRNDGLEIVGPRWQVEVQRARRAAIARARNRLLAASLGDAEWVLWLDVDVMDYPADLIPRLLAASKDIVTPHCVYPTGGSFDANTFILTNGRDDPKHLRDGLFQPPRGEGRRYLEDVADQELVRVDSVGGTALLVRGDLHRDGLNFPAYPYGGYIETEGLAMMARDMGHACWAMPKLHIVHPHDSESG